jgi:hypothetical protein
MEGNAKMEVDSSTTEKPGDLPIVVDSATSK